MSAKERESVLDELIKNVTHDDLETVAGFEREGFKEAFSLPELKRMLELDYCMFRKTEVGGTLAAYAIFYFIAGEAELLKVYVAPEYRGRGIAYRLITGCEKEIAGRGGRVIHIEVRESNASARALYLKAGYEESGRRREYYMNPTEDAILMHRHLDRPEPAQQPAE